MGKAQDVIGEVVDSVEERAPLVERVLTVQALKPWELQDGETMRSYNAFVVYRDMGPTRTIGKTAQYLGKTTRHLHVWSKEYGWPERALAWDNEQRRLEAEAHDKARLSAVDRQAKVAAAIIAQAARHLTPPEVDANGNKLTQEQKRQWKAKPEVVRMATYALKHGGEMERLAMGLPTAISAGQAEAEQAVKDAIAMQRMIMAIVNEGLCDDPNCKCCSRTRDRLAQVVGYQQEIERKLTPIAVPSI